MIPPLYSSPLSARHGESNSSQRLFHQRCRPLYLGLSLISDPLHSSTLPSKQVDQTLFRVHSHFFIRESNYWKKELVGLVPAHKNDVDEPLKKGGSRADRFEVKNVKSKEFAQLLWVFYNVYVIDNCSIDHEVGFTHVIIVSTGIIRRPAAKIG